MAPDGFGLFAIGWTIFRFFSIAGHLGLDSGVIKFGGKYWQNSPQKLRSVALIGLISAFLSGFFFGVLLYVCAPWLANEFFRKPDLITIFRGFAIIFPLATTLRVASATSSLSGKMLCGAISEDVAQPILQILFLLIFFRSGMGINAALLSTGISYGVSVVIGLICVARSLPQVFSIVKIQLDDLVPIFRFSLPAIVGVTLGAFNLWGDRLLVGYFSTEANTGIYQSISVITMFTTIILSGIKISIAPAISQTHHNGDHDGVEAMTKSMTRWALYVSLPILVFTYINAKELIIIFFGKEYLSGTIPLRILTVGQAFYVLFGMADQIFLMTGKQKEWVRISAFTFVLTIILDAISIPRFNLVGASIVSVTMMLLLGGLVILRLKHHLKFWLIDKYHGRIIGVSMVTILLIYPITSYLNIHSVIHLLTTFLAVLFVYFILLLLFGLETADKALLYQIIKKRLPKDR